MTVVTTPTVCDGQRWAENCEYQREGTAASRRAILRLRTEQVPTAVKMRPPLRRRERVRATEATAGGAEARGGAAHTAASRDRRTLIT